MQVFVLLLALAVIAPHESGAWPGARVDGATLAAMALGPYLLLVVSMVALTAGARRRLDRSPHSAERTLRRMHSAQTIVRWGALAMTWFVVFALGWPAWLTERIGVVPMAVELIVLAPALAVPIAGWWAQHPIERRLHDAAMLRRIDTAGPITPMPTRRAYVWGQVRHQLLMLLAPLLTVLLWVQVVQRYIPAGSYEPLVAIAGGGVVFALAPVMIRHLIDAVPMPPGEVRDMLERTCRDAGVRVRQLMLWRTHTGMINGAVMGVIGPLRYVMLTDGLIEQLPRPQVEAVMAHELGHVRRRHLPWLVITAFSVTAGAIVVFDVVAVGVGSIIDLPASVWDVLVGAMMLGAAGLWAVAFGFISRRFERQADTFAVQHLSRNGRGVVTPEAAAAMGEALLNVAHLNHAPADRPSWRHGSINWRVSYLRSLVGKPVDALPIDRQVRGLCIAAVLLLVGSALVMWSGWPA